MAIEISDEQDALTSGISIVRTIVIIIIPQAIL